jgi:hypothetical protein
VFQVCGRKREMLKVSASKSSHCAGSGDFSYFSIFDFPSSQAGNLPSFITGRTVIKSMDLGTKWPYFEST